MVRRRASEVHALRAVVLRCLQELRDVHVRPWAQVLVSNDRAAEPVEAGSKAGGEALPVSLAIAEDRHPLKVELLGGVVGRGRSLKLIGGRKAEEVVDARWSQLCGRWQMSGGAGDRRPRGVQGGRQEGLFGQAAVARAGTDEREVRAIGNRDLGAGDVRVEGADHGEDLRVRDQCADVQDSAGRIARLGGGVIPRVDSDREPIQGRVAAHKKTDAVER